MGEKRAHRQTSVLQADERVTWSRRTGEDAGSTPLVTLPARARVRHSAGDKPGGLSSGDVSQKEHARFKLSQAMTTERHSHADVLFLWVCVICDADGLPSD